MIHILHVIDCMENLGGAQEILVELVSRLSPQEFSQTLIRLHGKNSYEARLPLARVPSRSLVANKKQILTSIRRLYQHLKQQKYDVLHFHLQASTLLGVLLARLCGASNIVVTIYASKNQSSPWVFVMYALLVPFVDVYVGLTHHQLSGLTRHLLAKPFLSRTKTVLIPVGLDCQQIDVTRSQPSTIREELGLSPSSPLILNVARFRYRKGQAFLLRAMTLVVKEFPDVCCLLVGHGPDLERLQKLTRELSLEEHVVFLVSRSDLPNFFHAADLLVNSSIFEGMGVIIYQAMAYKKAVVGFNAGSVGEVVVGGETGILVPVRDYKALSAAIITLLKDKELREQYGIAGRKRIEEYFLLEDKIRDYEALYQHLMANP